MHKQPNHWQQLEQASWICGIASALIALLTLIVILLRSP